MAKEFKDMIKEELVKAAESLKLTDKVKESAKDPNKPTNAEYVTVLEAYKASQDEVNSETKKEVEEKKPSGAKKELKVTVDEFKRAELKKVKFKYIVTDHENSLTIDDDEEGRTIPIPYGNVTSGPLVWHVGLHGNPQALPFSVVKKLERMPMTKHVKNAKGEPTVKSSLRFRVTKVDGYSQDEIDELKRTQNTRKFKD